MVGPARGAGGRRSRVAVRATSVTCLPASGTTTVVLVTDGLAGARPAELATGRRMVARWVRRVVATA